MASMPGYSGTPGAQPSDLSTGLPAYQPVPQSASYTAMLNALQGQPSLQGFLPGQQTPVATPGGGSTGAPAIPVGGPVPAASALSPVAGNKGWLPSSAFHPNGGINPALTDVPTANYLHNAPTAPGASAGFSLSPRGAVGHLPGYAPPTGSPAGTGASGGFQGLLQALFSHLGAQTPQTPPVAGAPPQTSPWDSLSQWLQGHQNGQAPV